MTKPRVYKTEAIVLRPVALGEADRILTLYTPALGKLRAVARGVRRPSSKMGGHLEPLSQVSLLLARGRNLDTISQAQVLRPHARLRGSLETLSKACYLIDLVDAFTPEESPHLPLYHLLADALECLEEAPQPNLLLRFFELHLLALVGYQPELHACVACHQRLGPQGPVFSLRDGGVMCASCRHGVEDLLPLSTTALKALRYLLDNAYSQACRLRLEEPLAQEMERLLGRYIRYLLERDVRSAAFLHRLEAWEQQQSRALAAL